MARYSSWKRIPIAKSNAGGSKIVGVRSSEQALDLDLEGHSQRADLSPGQSIGQVGLQHSGVARHVRAGRSANNQAVQERRSTVPGDQ